MFKTSSKLLWHFDRTFGRSEKWFRQLIWLFSIILIVILVFAVAGMLFFGSCSSTQGPKKIVQQVDSTQIEQDENNNNELNIWQRTVGMILRSNGVDLKSKLPFGWQVILVFVGTFLVSGFVITYIGNLLRNRLKDYRNGKVRYKFSNHILFLGGSKTIHPMFKELYKKKEYRSLDFVVLTEAEPWEIRRQIDGALTDEEKKKLKITVLRGNRDDGDSLKSVHIDKASRIYIIGEKPFDPEHDSTNLACWNLAKELCSNRKDIPCFLMFERASSAFIFRHKEEADKNSCLDTTIVNRLESVAQRFLVQNEDENKIFPALDRKGINKDSERTVHLVLYGMTEVSYSLATIAAHLCHFPNFVKRNDDGTFGENKERRTKITMITPNMKEDRDYLTSHLSNLFLLSKVNLINEDGEKEEDIHKISENKDFGDFLDIEWTFVDGNIADERIRELLKGYYEENKKGKTYLTLAICQKNPDKNIAAALYLPNEFHKIEYKDEEKKEIDFEKTIPILVFQPESEEMLKTANREIMMFKNIFSFGSIKESYDPSIRTRISEGKRICYIYNRGENYAFMPSHQDDLDKIWRNESYANQMSNIYSASHIGVKLRSVDNREQLSDEDVQLLAITEHNRWNIEKLLMGYEALPKVEREKQKDPKGLEGLRKLKKQFKHYCIEPYSELGEEDKKYDTLIVKNLGDVIA